MGFNEDMRLANNLYYLGSIITLLDFPEREKTDEIFYNTRTYGKICRLKVNEELTIEAVFGQLGPDQFSMSDYELDQLYVQILKNGKITGLLGFHSSFPNSDYLGIDTDKFSDEVKKERIEKMKPTIFTRLQKVIQNFHSLDQHDIEAINRKSQEVIHWATTGEYGKQEVATPVEEEDFQTYMSRHYPNYQSELTIEEISDLNMRYTEMQRARKLVENIMMLSQNHNQADIDYSTDYNNALAEWGRHQESLANAIYALKQKKAQSVNEKANLI